MSYEIILRFIPVISILLCLALLVVIIWQNTIRKQYSITFILALILLLALLIWQFIIPNQYMVVVLSFAIGLMLYQVIIRFTNKKPITNTEISFNIGNSEKLITQAKEQERSRIYANLHDDVGAKLLELIYTAENEQTKNLAKEVLNDIRQAVASTVNIQCTIKQLIDEITAEAQSRLQPCNIEVTTQIDLSDRNPKLANTIPSVINRIFREITSNIIKHAQATQVRINVQSIDNQLAISFIDNGKGITEKDKNGKGFKTIEKRANSIKAIVNWHSEIENGTQFNLTYPYEH